MNIDIKTVLLLLSAALGLSLVIERILEAVKGLMKKILLSEDSPFAEKAEPVEAVMSELAFQKIHNTLDDLVEEIEEIRIEMQKATGDKKKRLKKKEAELEKQAADLVNKYTELFRAHDSLTQKQAKDFEQKKKSLEARFKEGKLDTDRAEFSEKFSQATVILDPIAPHNPEKTARVFWIQIIGTFGGVLICHFSKFGIFNYLVGMADQLDWILTGILIGGGSQPIHTLIKFIQSRQTTDLIVDNEPTVVAEEDRAGGVPQAPAIVKSQVSEKLEIDIEYHGGVDRDELEHIHKRPKNPDLIVYHHTAMHSDTTFADVVKVIKDKNWSTGYHCVILKDGSIHPFCRWDRYGNHVKGFNRTSLGISLNGNFESNPKVPFSNVNGSLGNLRPTDEQLLSACKVVALWCHLYDIPIEFSKSILPHRDIAPKACPGSNFPYSKFKTLVENIYEKWRKSPQAQDEIILYKQKQYLYV